MKYNKVFVLAFAAIILAVVASGNASAMVPQASLNDGPSAGWDNDPSNSFTVARGSTFSETCKWVYATDDISGNIDGVYCYSSIYTSPQYNQVLYRDLLSAPGQSQERSTTVTASSTNYGANKPYNICLGFWWGLNNYFTSTDQETITVT
ncbi:hypothetical protein [Methanocella arvoryzae]|uniref:Uncharacterized protein n=1 Tax=Methanocella arvoryzae (strain DSM 22066 / NBRC 105507 / MRE50) TaxID=351160 RepID=Q0W608_METAR|nr:hypothetical protein [Methanocella arvoryzae]CAJ36185.1 hypothetical protein RCIA44 [Methanocella arvoryzae MRE50]